MEVVNFRVGCHLIKKYGTLEVDLHSFLTAALDGSGQLQGQMPFN
jgi:hypothetical protein